MQYEEALKKASEIKNDAGYMKISFGYTDLLLPYKDGANIITALAHAEVYDQGYSEPPKICPLSSDKVKASRFSRQDYVQAKMAQLMEMPLNDFKEAEKTRKVSEPV